MSGTRIAPDNNDIVVWKLDEAAAPFVNSSTSPSAPANSNLTTLSGTIQLQQPSPFAPYGANSCVRFTATNSSSPRNFISGANNLTPQPPITISFWFNLRTYNNSGFVQHLIAKQITTGVWSGGTFGSLYVQNVSTGSSIYWTGWVTSGGQNGPQITMPLNMWCHLGITYDGAVTKTYLNGTLVGETTVTGNINYTSGNPGPWFVGAIPSGSGNPEETAVALCDIRIANVIRDVDYFKEIYNAGATVTGSGVPLNTYYKLRAYDLACTPPLPMYWVSRFISFAEAPVAPCGNYGPIEIVEEWSLIGFAPAVTPTIENTLNGLSWLLPNTGEINTTVCRTVANTTVSEIIPGDTGVTYNITLRFRGVVEQKTYTGGTNDGAYWQIGGTPDAGPFNVYSLTVSDPPQTYYLNRGTSGITRCFGIDYTQVIQATTGATITLFADAKDGQEIKNQDGTGNNPISISGITSPPQPYNGQFIIMNVLHVEEA